jgi:hypothetical protein
MVQRAMEVIDNYIHYQITRMHIAPIIKYLLLKKIMKPFFLEADDAPQLKQMKNKFVAKYDFDGKKSMELRQQWWQQGQQ